MQKLFLGLSLLFFSLLQAQLSSTKKNEIAEFVDMAMQELEISGAAIAIIKENQVVYKDYLGKANLEHNVPISESSLFRLHSLSKVFVAVGIFQLIESGKISLEDKISIYLPDVPESWKDIAIKHLLSHSSGLPDMREETSTDEEVALKNIYNHQILFSFGERANYNQTNFWILNRIIRNVTKGTFEDFITKQFEENSEVCFSNVLDIVPNRVMEYKPNNKGELQNFHFVVPKYLYGAAGITMTLQDLIDWNQKLFDNTLLSETSIKKMFTPFEYQIGQGFSYGWDIQKLNGVVSYGFNGGGLVNYRVFPSKDLSIIWFTNGYRIPHNVDHITNRILGMVDTDLIDRTPEFTKLLGEAVSSGKPKKLAKAYQNLKEQYPYVNYERAINGLGYDFLQKNVIHNALMVFKLNAEEFPNSANVFDSLAEGYYYNQQYELSKENYLKSLELNPGNNNATEMLKKIESEN